MSQNIPLLGRIALKLGFIDMDQLAEATRAQARAGDGKHLGKVMLELGFIDDARLQKILQARQQLVAKARATQAEQVAGQAVAQADSTPEVAPVATSELAPVATHELAPAAAPVASPPPAVVGAQPAAAAADPAAVQELVAVLKRGLERGASDIHIHSGSPLRLRLHGRFVSADQEPLAPEQAERIALAALDADQRRRFDEAGEIDLAYTSPGIGRFRVNIYRQQRGVDGVFRSISAEPPTLEGLGLPSNLARFTNYHQGMVLVTGPANCGKSATLASMVDIINTERREHILTIEDPIEVLHPSKRCVVNQRMVGPHTESFARALRAALREDPDVIVIGELRDLETISLALTAAETGHLVLATLHTNSTLRTINRLVGVFPADQQGQIRNLVSESLRAVVSQRLVPTADGNGRAPALEILVNNKAIGNLIRENKTFQIFSMLQTGAAHGMCLFDDSLNKLVAAGTITAEEALKHCEDPKRIRTS